MRTTDDTRPDPLREWRLIHDLDVDFEAGVVRCKCGNFAGTTTFMEHLSAVLAAATEGLDVERLARALHAAGQSIPGKGWHDSFAVQVAAEYARLSGVTDR